MRRIIILLLGGWFWAACSGPTVTEQKKTDYDDVDADIDSTLLDTTATDEGVLGHYTDSVIPKSKQLADYVTWAMMDTEDKRLHPYAMPDTTKEGWTAWFQKEGQGLPFLTNYQLPRNISNENISILQDDRNRILMASRKGVVIYDGEDWYTVPTPQAPTVLRKEPQTGLILVGCKEEYGYLRLDDKGAYHYESLAFGEEKASLGTIMDILYTQEYLFFCSDKVVLRMAKANMYERRKWQRDADRSEDRPYSGFFIYKDRIYASIKKRGIYRLDFGFDNFAKQRKPYYRRMYTYLEKAPNNFRKAQREAFEENLKAFVNSDLLFSFPLDSDNVVLGFSNNRLYVFNHQEPKKRGGHDRVSLTPYALEANGYLEENILVGGMSFSDTEFAVATATGGCLVIRKNFDLDSVGAMAKTIATINYQTGLPEDEVFALGVDVNHGLWIAHEYGLSRANFSLPITGYQNYAGLEGKLNSVAEYDSTVYVSTTEGVFFLTELKVFDIQEQQVKVQSKVKKYKKVKVNDKKSTSSSSKTSTSQQKKKGLFNRFRKSKTTTQASSKKKPTSRTVTKSYFTTVTKTETVSKYMLQSVDKVFLKVDSLEAKCRQLVRYNNRLLVATNTGVFEIVDPPMAKGKSTKKSATASKVDQPVTKRKLAVPILEGYYVHAIELSADSNRFYIATEDAIFDMAFVNGAWSVNEYMRKTSTAYDRYVRTRSGKRLRQAQQSETLISLGEPVYSVAEGDSGAVWLGCDNKVYRATKAAKAFKGASYWEFKEYSLAKSAADKVLVKRIKGKLYFMLYSGVFAYDAAKDSIVADNPFLPSDLAIVGLDYKASQDSLVWISQESLWACTRTAPVLQDLASTFLNLFDKVQSIYVDSMNNIWVVDGENRLNKILANTSLSNPESEFEVLVKEVASRDEKLPILQLELDPEENSLEFDIVASFYAKTGAITYQHKIDGLTQGWSKWTDRSFVEYPYIPAGSYELEVRAKNALGQISQVRKLKFSIKPFWYETAWFYILQITAFSLMLLGSYFLNKKGKYLKLSKILTYIVVIVVMKFLGMSIMPLLSEFTGGVPVFKIVMSIMLGLALNPAEALFTKMLKQEKKAEDN